MSIDLNWQSNVVQVLGPPANAAATAYWNYFSFDSDAVSGASTYKVQSGSTTALGTTTAGSRPIGKAASSEESLYWRMLANDGTNDGYPGAITSKTAPAFDLTFSLSVDGSSITVSLDALYTIAGDAELTRAYEAASR